MENRYINIRVKMAILQTDSVFRRNQFHGDRIVKLLYGGELRGKPTPYVTMVAINTRSISITRIKINKRIFGIT